jgi:hypothetical protein
MTDYIAFDENKIPFSIYDVEQNVSLKKCDLYCICGQKVFYKKNSIVFEDKLGRVRQKISHFSHYKNAECKIYKIIKDNEDKSNNKIEDAPVLTEIEKRIKRIIKIIKYIEKSTKIYLRYKYEINVAIRKSNENNLEYSQYYNDFINNIRFNKNEYIGFKDLEFKKTENNIIYIINEILCKALSTTLIVNICSDFERYVVYVKQLALVAVYASRCTDTKIIEKKSKIFIDSIEQNIKRKIYRLYYNTEL